MEREIRKIINVYVIINPRGKMKDIWKSKT